MEEKSFEHRGHQVTINVLQNGERWSWSYRIDDREPVSNAQSGAPSEDQALSEARHEAIAAIKALQGGA